MDCRSKKRDCLKLFPLFVIGMATRKWSRMLPSTFSTRNLLLRERTHTHRAAVEAAESEAAATAAAAAEAGSGEAGAAAEIEAAADAAADTEADAALAPRAAAWCAAVAVVVTGECPDDVNFRSLCFHEIWRVSV